MNHEFAFQSIYESNLIKFKYKLSVFYFEL